MFAGPNGSGKSTILSELKEEWIGVYVNADDIEKVLKQTGELDLANYELIRAPGDRLHRQFAHSPLLAKAGLTHLANQVVVDGFVIRFGQVPVNSYFASEIADYIRNELLAQGASFTFETVMSHEGKVEFMAKAQAAGYRTYLYFVATESPTINVERVRQRVEQGGHPVEPVKIVERYHRSIELLESATNAADRAYIFDNSGDAHLLVAEVTGGQEMKIHADALPRWFTQSPLWAAFQP
jgi:predicted ABC-type ATPase